MQRCSHGAGAVYDTSPRGVTNAPAGTWLQRFPVEAAVLAAPEPSEGGSAAERTTNAGDTPIRLSLRAGSATTVQTKAPCLIFSDRAL